MIIYKGQEDIKDKVIRAVGDSVDRFTEDALRMLQSCEAISESSISLFLMKQ